MRFLKRLPKRDSLRVSWMPVRRFLIASNRQSCPRGTRAFTHIDTRNSLARECSSNADASVKHCQLSSVRQNCLARRVIRSV
jgi:hypothetical protein